MLKALIPNDMTFKRTADSAYTTRFVLAPLETDYSDIFRPEFWSHTANHLSLGDLIRVRREDNAWDFMISVIGKSHAAVVVDVWPKFPKEISRADHEAMAHVAQTARRVMTTTLVHGKPVPRVDHTRATKWRIIGLDGNEHSSGHPTKAVAEQKMKEYLVAMGVEEIVDPPAEPKAEAS